MSDRHGQRTGASEATLAPIIGVSQRSGTHYLASVLGTHPHVYVPGRGAGRRGADWEDLLLVHAELLVSYAEGTASSWNFADPTRPAAGDLLRELGAALERFVSGMEPASAARHQVVVVKSPTAEGVELLPRLWPSARPVLLVRDAADVVASATASFGGLAERWIRVWRAGARSIAAFEHAHPGVGLRVRYEDLHADPVAECQRICRHVGIDEHLIDADRIAALPVRGSSQVASAGDTLHWGHVDPTGFRPIGRGAGLSDAVRSRIAHLAGPELAALGYQIPEDRLGPTRHRALDGAWVAGRAARRATASLRP